MWYWRRSWQRSARTRAKRETSLCSWLPLLVPARPSRTVSTGAIHFGIALPTCESLVCSQSIILLPAIARWCGLRLTLARPGVCPKDSSARTCCVSARGVLLCCAANLIARKWQQTADAFMLRVRERKGENKKKKRDVCVCVFVCVCERERERERERGGKVRGRRERVRAQPRK